MQSVERTQKLPSVLGNYQLGRRARFSSCELTRTWGCATQRELHDLWLGQNKTSLLTFTPCDLLRLIRGRTVWLSGDSQQQDMMKALMCFLFEVAPPLWQRLVRAVEPLPF